MTMNPAATLPIQDASARGVSRLAADAQAGKTTVLVRRNIPIAAVVSFDESQRLAALERDLIDLALVLTRFATDDGKRTSLDDVITGYGYTRADLEALNETEEPDEQS